jgi:hypothetical protein
MASIQASGQPQAVGATSKTEHKGLISQLKEHVNQLKTAAFGERGGEIAKETFKGALGGAIIGSLVLPGPGTLLGAAAGAAIMGGKEAVDADAKSEEISNKATGMGAGAVVGAVAFGPLGIPLGMIVGSKIASGEAKEAVQNMTDFIKEKFAKLTSGD